MGSWRRILLRKGDVVHVKMIVWRYRTQILNEILPSYRVRVARFADHHINVSEKTSQTSLTYISSILSKI